MHGCANLDPQQSVLVLQEAMAKVDECPAAAFPYAAPVIWQKQQARGSGGSL